MSRPKYETVQARRSDEIPRRLGTLAEMLTKELGVPVVRLDALRIAIDEAIERRERKGKR